MNTTSHIVQGTWRRPSARQVDFNDLDYWVNLAKTLERGRFDAIFFADVVGVYPPHRGDQRKFFEAGIQVPSNDPSALVSALAYVTENLGFAFTSSVLQDHPFHFARRISTLDHLTKGRVAWNIVTNYLPNASRNFGLEGLTAHDDRYAWADEYVDVTYKLWEGSWEDDALVQDRESGLHTDFDKVHTIDHVGPRYSVEGPHLVAPSPQRTPLLFQAGASEAGRTFAATNAEAVFLQSGTVEAAARDTADIRARAVRHGRSADDLKFFLGRSVVPASTEEEAKRKAAEIDEWIDYEGHLAHFAGSIGVDVGDADLDTPIGELETEGLQSALGWIKDMVPDRPATLRDAAHLLSTNGRIVGTPEQIADTFEKFQAAGIDGFNLMNVEIPGSYEDFIDHVTPVLQERGLAQREYTPGTLRNKLFGRGDRLPDTHPAARYRGAFGSTKD